MRTGIALGLIFTALGILAFRKEIRCLWIGRHETVRHPLGPHRCIRCGKAFESMEAAGAFGKVGV